MPSRRYLDFDLLLEQRADGEYQALVTGSPLGEATSGRFRLPFDDQTLEILMLKLDPGRLGTRRVGANAQQQAAMDFGGPLFEASLGTTSPWPGPGARTSPGSRMPGCSCGSPGHPRSVASRGSCSTTSRPTRSWPSPRARRSCGTSRCHACPDP